MLAPMEKRHYPWNRGSAQNVKVKTAKDILKATNTNFTVEKAPLKAVTSKGDSVLSAFDYGLVRMDTRQILSTVKTRYEIIQPLEQAQFGLSLMDAADVTLAGGGELLGGRIVWYSFILPEEITFPGMPDDALLRTLSVVNDHGEASWRARADAWRQVCVNGLVAPIPGAASEFKIRHTTTAKERMKVAADVMGRSYRYFDGFSEEVAALLNKAANEKVLTKTVEHLYPRPDEDANVKAHTRWDNRFEEIIEAWRTSPNVDNFRNTHWGVYNAITEWSQWGRDFYGDGGDEEIRAQLQPQEILIGQSAKHSMKAFAFLSSEPGVRSRKAKAKVA